MTAEPGEANQLGEHKGIDENHRTIVGNHEQSRDGKRRARGHEVAAEKNEEEVERAEDYVGPHGSHEGEG